MSTPDVSGLLRQAHLAVQQNNLEAARQAGEEALRIDNRSADAQALLGWIALRQRRPEAALDHYSRAAALHPGEPNLLQSVSDLQSATGDHDGAVATARRLLELRPDVVSKLQLGKALNLAGLGAESVAYLEEAAALAPSAATRAWLAQAFRNVGRGPDAMRIVRALAQEHPREVQFADLAAVTSIYAHGVQWSEVLRHHRAYDALVVADLVKFAKPAHRIAQEPLKYSEPLRIGIVSSDLRRHAVSFFLLPLLENLDPARIKLVFYSVAHEEDAVTERYRALGEFRPVRPLRGDVLVRQIVDDGIHVLLDLSGHTTNHRLPIFELRPAPVQMSYLGYSSTTGMSAIDYRIVDSQTDPAGYEERSVEALLRLNPVHLVFRPFESMPEPGPLPSAAQQVGKGITFGCFGAADKHNDAMFALWGRILRAVPSSQLLLKHSTFREQTLRSQLEKRLVEAGCPADRVRVEEPAPSARTLLHDYARVDISLDTFPYHGTTTLCESLYMGVPVVSLAGDRTGSRMGLTILNAVGLPGLCAADEDGYVQAAATLAADGPRLAELRASLRGRFEQSPLRDEIGLARKFEAALHGTFNAWALGQRAPQQ